MTLETGLAIAAVVLIIGAVAAFALIARKTRLTYQEVTFAAIGLAALGFSAYAFYAEYKLSGQVSPLALIVFVIAGLVGVITWRHAKKRLRGSPPMS